MGKEMNTYGYPQGKEEVGESEQDASGYYHLFLAVEGIWESTYKRHHIWGARKGCFLPENYLQHKPVVLIGEGYSAKSFYEHNPPMQAPLPTPS